MMDPWRTGHRGSPGPRLAEDGADVAAADLDRAAAKAVARHQDALGVRSTAIQVDVTIAKRGTKDRQAMLSALA
jgi:hypothetical protein